MRATILALLVLLSASPAFAETSGVFIHPGESVIFHLDHGQPVGMRPATAQDQPASGEIEVSLATGPQGSMMKVVNNTPDFLNYRAFISAAADAAGKRTSVCTLMNNGRMSFENWPGLPIPGIRLSDFAVAPADQMACR